jgi:hypothetical protein
MAGGEFCLGTTQGGEVGIALSQAVDTPRRLAVTYEDEFHRHKATGGRGEQGRLTREGIPAE